MKINFNNQTRVKGITAIKEIIKLSIEKTLQIEGIKTDIEVSVLLTGNAEIHILNRDYRNKDSATDVLSFPFFEKDELPTALQQPSIYLGDIAISLEKAKEQSIEFDHSFERETAYLTSHSLLHLLGYDHEDENERKIMRKKEEAAMVLLDLSAERS